MRASQSKFYAAVHRFGDAVACSVGTGETAYLSADHARKFARALLKASQSVEREEFQKSEGLTFSLDIGEQRDYVDNPRRVKLERDATGRAIKQTKKGATK